MFKNTYKVLLIFLLFSFGFNIKVNKPEVCAGSYSDEDITFFFFKPITFDKLINYKKPNKNVNENIEAWKSYFGKGFSTDEVNSVVYKMTISDLEKIKGRRANEVKPNNKIVSAWANGKNKESIDYLIFAKTIEPLVVSENEWNPKKAYIEASKAKELIAQAKKNYKKTKSKFLKLRYAYQAVRVAHYSKKYDEAINMYNKLVNPLFKKGGVIKYWALEHKAGALAKKGKIAEASYLFAKVFDNSDARKTTSFNSFKINTNQSWNEALNMCKNGNEKAIFYFIRALQPNADILAEMKAIYKIAPTSPYLDRLMVSLIKDLEKGLLSKMESYNVLMSNYAQEDRAIEKLQYLKETQTFLSKVNQEKKTLNSSVYVFAEAYTYFLNNNQSKALSILNSTSYKTVTAKKRKEVVSLAMSLANLKKVDKKVENTFYKKVKATNDKDLMQFMIAIFAKHYKSQNEVVKAYLAVKTYYDLKVEMPAKTIDKLLLWVQKNNKSQFEKEVLVKSLGKNPLKNVKNLKATVLFSQGKIREAIKVYESIQYNYKIKGDPFKENTVDCLGCDRDINPSNKYTRLTLAKKILKMQEQLKRKEDAQINFELGLAYYNMSYFGNAWDAHRFKRSSSDIWYLKYSKDNKEQAIYKSNFDCSIAQKYFDKAYQLAKRNNRELAAKAAFHAAKCEQNAYYISDKFNSKTLAYNKGFDKYFGILRKEFTNTKFYQEALQECFYLRNY